MALVKNNQLTQGISGAVGNMLVFKQLNGKTYVTRKPALPTKQSELQRENRNRFKCASYYAKNCMRNEEKKAYYWRKAKKLKLPNAYTAAIADYMRRGEIKEIDTRQFKGKPGNTIRIHVKKNDFAIQKVNVSLYDGEGKLLERNIAAVKKERGLFIFKNTHDFVPGTLLKIRVALDDYGSKKVMKEVEVRVKM